MYFVKMVNDQSEEAKIETETETETSSNIIKSGDSSALQDPKIELPIYLP